MTSISRTLQICRGAIVPFTAVLFLAGTLSTAHANLLLNGSFEQGNLPNPSGTTLTAGSTAIEHWIVGGHGIDWIGAYWQAADGSRSLDLDSGTILGAGPYDGSISQSFATTAGSQYRVTFEMAGNPDGGPVEKPLEVSAGGHTELFTFDNSLGQTRSNMGYESRAFQFTASDVSTMLTFTSLSGTGYGPVIDNVSVTLVPEPTSVSLATLALAALATFAIAPKVGHRLWVRKR